MDLSASYGHKIQGRSCFIEQVWYLPFWSFKLCSWLNRKKIATITKPNLKAMQKHAIFFKYSKTLFVTENSSCLHRFIDLIDWKHTVLQFDSIPSWWNCIIYIRWVCYHLIEQAEDSSNLIFNNIVKTHLIAPFWPIEDHCNFTLNLILILLDC